MDLERRKEILDQLLRSGEISATDYEIMFAETIDKHLVIETSTTSGVSMIAPNEKPTPSSKKSVALADHIVEKILERLYLFEQNQEYLLPNITLGVLATQLATNSKYLSKIINQYKEKSYTQYINDLRISYALEQLHSNPIFFQYTIKAIALEIGFNTPEAFSKAFLKKTGMYPSQYINALPKVR